MIIVKLVVAGKEQGDAVANIILKNKFTLDVFGNALDSYHLNSSQIKVHTEVYFIQFVTKSMLFDEIEESLKKEFPGMDFYICATPIVHMAITLHHKIKKRVTGLSLTEEETED
ncbi:MAG: hypothetical protein K2Q24_08625 [Chitinophagaceae bacterium]|jgi:hypothetical protein|nr:hypothetical protein [Chitinophagaceae bacterium]